MKIGRGRPRSSGPVPQRAIIRRRRRSAKSAAAAAPGPRFRLCQFNIGWLETYQCPRTAHWEIGWTYLCWRHVLLLRELSRTAIAKPVRVSWPK